jgi:hypothetical protein
MSKVQSNSAGAVENQTTETKAVEGVSAEDTKNKTVTATVEELKLSDEQWSKVFEHPRFKELNERATTAEKQLKEKLDAEAKSQQKKLKEEGKYQELLEEKEKEIESIKSSLAETLLNNEVISIASKLKVLDTEAVVKLIDRSKLQIDKDGRYLNTEEVVKNLLSDKPYLVGEGNSTNSSVNIGANSNTTTGNQSGDFVITKSELREKARDTKWYTEHKDEITTWQKEGRIDYSR